MVEGQVDGVLSQEVICHVGVSGVPVGADVMVDRFSHPVVEESHPNTTCEQHGEPGGSRVFGFFVVLAQFEVTIFGEVQNYHEQRPKVLETQPVVNYMRVQITLT